MTVTGTSAYPAVRLARRASWVVRREDGGTVMTVDGDLDLASSGAFVAALAAVGAGGTDAVIDMAGVGFMDSSTLRALVGAHRLFERLGLRLTVRAPSRPVRRMLALCRLEEVINTA
jgi:anti-anti-sigma factor